MTKLQVILCSLFLVSASISQSVDIFYEIANCDYQAVQYWIKFKPDFSIRNELGQSIVHAAVLTGKVKMVKEVLRSPVDVNICDNNGKTALDIASDYGDRAIVCELVGVGASVTSSYNEAWVKKTMHDYKWYSFYALRLYLVNIGAVYIIAMVVGTMLFGVGGLFLMPSFIVLVPFPVFIAINTIVLMYMDFDWKLALLSSAIAYSLFCLHFMLALSGVTIASFFVGLPSYAWSAMTGVTSFFVSVFNTNPASLLVIALASMSCISCCFANLDDRSYLVATNTKSFESLVRIYE